MLAMTNAKNCEANQFGDVGVFAKHADADGETARSCAIAGSAMLASAEFSTERERAITRVDIARLRSAGGSPSVTFIQPAVRHTYRAAIRLMPTA